MSQKKKKLQKNEFSKSKMIADAQNLSGMISQDAETITKIRKNRKMKIIAFIVAIAFVLGAIGGSIAGILTFNNEGSFFYNVFKRGSLNRPQNLRIEDFDEQTSFSFLVRWDKVANATSYTLECKYELYPDVIDTYEVFAKDGRYIERKRGEFWYRAKANNLSGSSDFSEWKSFVIPPMQLDLPEITMLQIGNDVIVSWTEVQYKYFNNYGTVFYECIEGGYYIDEEQNVFPANEPLLTYDRKYTFENVVHLCDIFTIKVRPINYIFMMVPNEINGMPERIIMNEPAELYDIYVGTDEWAEQELILEK